MRRLIEGTLDIGLMYTPGHGPGLVVEHLFDETLVLVSSRADEGTPGEDYIYVERGRASITSMPGAIRTRDARRRS